MDVRRVQTQQVNYPISIKKCKQNAPTAETPQPKAPLVGPLSPLLIKPLDVNHLKLAFPKLHKQEKTKTVFVIAIGVNGQKDDKKPLNYANKDATDFNKFIMDKKANHRGSVHVLTLQNEYAKKDSILATLKWVQDNSQAQDEVYVLMSGHGMVDFSTQHYYYLSYNDKLSPGSLISDVWLGQLLSQMKGNVKLFLDTCFSNNFNDYMSIHVKNYESTTFASFAASKSYQLSYESNLLKNGFFTYAVLRGLAGAADLNGDQKVSNEELMKYTKLSVTANSNGIQTPDFLIAK